MTTCTGTLPDPGGVRLINMTDEQRAEMQAHVLCDHLAGIDPVEAMYQRLAGARDAREESGTARVLPPEVWCELDRLLRQMAQGLVSIALLSADAEPHHRLHLAMTTSPEPDDTTD